jgi:hypothetical protein
MPLTTRTVNIDISPPTGVEILTTAVPRVAIRLNQSDVDIATDEVIPALEAFVDLNSSGVATIALWPNDRGSSHLAPGVGTFYTATLYAIARVDMRAQPVAITLGNFRVLSGEGAVSLADLLAVGAPDISAVLSEWAATEAAARGYAEAAEASANLSSGFSTSASLSASAAQGHALTASTAADTATSAATTATTQAGVAVAAAATFAPPDAVVPAQVSEPIIATSDGYALAARVGDVLRLGAAVDVALAGSGAALTVPDLDATSATIADTSFRQGDEGLSIGTTDFYTVLRQDADTGALLLLTGPGCIQLPGSVSLIPGVIQPGAVTDVSRQGDTVQYLAHGPAFGGRVMARDMRDWASPHIPLCADLEIVEGNGQSWASEVENSENLDVSDPTGRTRAALEAAFTPEVSILRRSDRLTTLATAGSYDNTIASISNGTVPGELHRFDGRRYTVARAATLCATIQRKRLGVVAKPQIVLDCGWPGTSHELFLPPDTTVNYTNDAGTPSSFSSASHPDAGAFLWTRDVARRTALDGVIETRWPEFAGAYRFLTWIQGVPNDTNEYRAFLDAWRAAQDTLGLGNRHLIIDQNGGRSDRVTQFRGVQAQVEWAQANASGRDWLASPRYPFSLEDVIHHSAFGALEYAERVGQAMAYIDRYGEWQPLWVTGVAISGADVTLTVNTPRQTYGGLVVDAETVPAAANHGFSLWQTETDTAITISSVTVGTNTITVTAAATLSGVIEVGYAVRGVTRTTGTTAAPSYVGTIGNIKRRGRDAPAIIPASVRPELDHWLCQYRKNHEV